MAKTPDFTRGTICFIGMLLPLLYFGGFLYYFSRVGGGSLQGVIDIGLGPTMFGLGLLGLVFAIKPLYLLFRFVIGLTTGAGTGQRNSAAGGATNVEGAASDFDAEDAIARYLRNRGAEPAPVADPVIADPAGPPPRPSFGRKAN
jgi:hypothetical protein